MKQLQVRMLLFALIGVAFIMGIGAMIAEKSVIGTIICIIGTIGTMGFGFATKAKLRKQQQ